MAMSLHSLCILIELLVLLSVTTHARAGSYVPNGTDSWICLPSSGDADPHGGSINYTSCGTTCGGSGGGDTLQWLGYIGAIVAVAGFGSNFIPVKKFDTGDGLFFQWIMCIGIWLVGMVVNFIRQQPPFFLPALIGGFAWVTGNIVVVPIIKMIGITMGLTVWGSTNLLSGWISGRFILGQDINCAGLNYGGLVTVLLSTFILAFVKSEGKAVKTDETKPLLSKGTDSGKGTTRDSIMGDLRNKLVHGSTSSSVQSETKLSFSSVQFPVDNDDQDVSWVDHLGVWPRRVLGFTLSLIAGFFFGFQFLPLQFLRLCTDSDHSCDLFDYAFSHFTGIFIASTLYFIIYCAIRCNKPQIYPKLILPALVSGIMWGVAMLGWFLANQHLSLAVSFPFVTAGPGFISFGYGLFLYREIKGWKNIAIYAVACAVSVAGLIMVGLSSCTVHC